MTVPELRVACKRLGLPYCQRKGQRMSEYDLCRQLFVAGFLTYDKAWPYSKRLSNVGIRTSMEGFRE